MIFYELWDLRSRNIVGTYPTEADALAVVRETINHHGREYVDDLVLGWGDDEDEKEGEEVASGAALVERALKESAA